MICGGCYICTPSPRSWRLDSPRLGGLVHLVPLWVRFWVDKNMESLGYRLLAARQGVGLGSIRGGFCSISAFKHSKIKRVKRRMTGRALHLFDLISWLNSANLHCWIRFNFLPHFAWDPGLEWPLAHFISSTWHIFSPCRQWETCSRRNI